MNIFLKYSRCSFKMVWFAFLFFVSSSISDIETFGNDKYYRFGFVTQPRCVLPQYPENGGYTVVNATYSRPGDEYKSVSLVMYTINKEFELEIAYLVCDDGTWSEENVKRVAQPVQTRTWNYFKNYEENPNINSNANCCILPPYPEHGHYVVVGDANAKPGDVLLSVNLEYSCTEGYSISGNNKVCCEYGTWHDEAPMCIDAIVLPNHSEQVQSRISTKNESDTCKLPPQPEHGHYEVTQQSRTDYDGTYTVWDLSFTCDAGYGIVGSDSIFCINDAWSAEVPKCVQGCKLNYTTGVDFKCKEEGSKEFSRLCQIYEPNNEVLPLCDTPNYSSRHELPPMKCIGGKWNYTPECFPECGIKQSRRTTRTVQYAAFAAGGRTAVKKELPWHVGIYNKLYQPYMQICGGTIISTELVVTAAHCFWNDLEGLQPSSRFAVAAGKIYRPWHEPNDYGAQFNDVKNIVIPKRFRGAQTNFQDDIAIVYVSTPFTFNTDVWPVCVDFDLNLDRVQLSADNLGTAAGWGLTDEDGKAAPVLQVVALPYVEIGQCIDDASPDFRAYITSDKMCAGYTNGTALCKGDSGGGLAFPMVEGQLQRYYLRGVASTAPNNERLCNTHAVTTFTQILAHEHFIRDHFNGSIV